MKFKLVWVEQEKCFVLNIGMLYQIFYVWVKHSVGVLCQQVKFRYLFQIVFYTKSYRFIGAFIGSEKLWTPLFTNPFLHTTTFGGNPLACAAAIATINVLLEERLCERARTVGDVFLAKLKATIKPYAPHLTLDARGKGLMLALEFVDTDIGFRVAKGLFREKILCAGTLVNAKTIRIEPPLTITLEQVDNVINALEKVLKEIADEMKPQPTNELTIKTTPGTTLQRTVLSLQL